MAFPGHKLHGNLQGDVITDQIDFSRMPKRLQGRRVKHRTKRNWMKMYNKEVLHGFTNRELCAHLVRAGFPLAPDAAKHSGQVTRLLRRLYLHQLVAKIPRSRRWRVSLNGRRVDAAIKTPRGRLPGSVRRGRMTARSAWQNAKKLRTKNLCGCADTANYCRRPHETFFAPLTTELVYRFAWTTPG